MRKLLVGCLACTFIIGVANADLGQVQPQRPGTSGLLAVPVQGVTGGVPVPVSGSVTVSSASCTQGTSPWVVGQTTAANLLATVTQGPAGASAWKVDGTGGTFPVSGPIALSAGAAVIGHVINDASAAVIGHVIADSGSTTAVTGNVTVVQPTGTSLHAVLDTTSTTACTQATGTNLHAVLDTTSTTACTQATAANLNAQVQGAGASGASKAGNPVQTGYVFNTTQPTVTTGQGVEAQGTARGAAIVATGVDTFNVTVNAALPAGSALIGKTGIDQTTMGTTNGVVPMPTTVAGAALSQKPFTANTALSIKASAGNVYGWSAINAAAAVCWLQFYNTAGTPTCGTSVIWSVPLPVTPGVSNFVPANLPLQNHATGIAICVSTTATGATTCGSTASGTIFYQ